LLGGDLFHGRAAGENGLLKNGRFALLGPVAYFASDDGALNGIAEQRLGSLEPSVQPYADPAYAPMTRDFVAKGEGLIPFDASLGSARKIEETQEGLVEHFLKGGSVMWPILAVAILSASVIVSKWLVFSLTRMPAPRRLDALLEAVRQKDTAAACRAAKALPGPAGAMLRAGAEYLNAPKDLIEEVMFEKMLDTRFRLNKALPLVAVCAACAPLLGLLGTVTGIIATFKLITVFGSGDVKMLSAGISEALITTEYGLYVAIPSILAHSFLSRKAKAIMDKMERVGIAFLTEIEKAKSAEAVT
jgi:biopolymer transport protein ExbB